MIKGVIFTLTILCLICTILSGIFYRQSKEREWKLLTIGFSAFTVLGLLTEYIILFVNQ